MIITIILAVCFIILCFIFKPLLDVTTNGWLIVWYTDVHSKERRFKFLINIKQ